MKIEVEYEMPRWPNYIRQKASPRRRQDGANFDTPCLSVGELTQAQIEVLVDDFRAHCARRREGRGDE